ncbi:hypothetical protein NKI41_32220 [Mesorhizobium sp. M0601]|uniref:glycine cleavage T C-terminal barrel domain-containing protein n=1 Tax=Mesorhizobium sp. M0601 TaxID=2956969 RepID=UPI0033367ECB
MFGTEPVWRDGILVGNLRSAGFGHTIGCGVGMGYLHAESGVSASWLKNGKFEVEIAGNRYAGVVSMTPRGRA